MKLSTKGRYGLKAMFELALHEGKGPIPLKIIAERQELSDQYLEQLFSSLRRGGLVKSVRGAQGGYLLARSSDKITVGDVIRLLEGPVAPAECVLYEREEGCERLESCVTRVIWEKIKESVDQVMDSITLKDMLDDYEKKMDGKNKIKINFLEE